MKKDLLSCAELTVDDLNSIIELSQKLKKERGTPEAIKPLAGKSIGMIFAKSSTRTRVSFEVGIQELGGYPVKREGSQGQCKTYLVALKLAQFLFLKQTGRRQTPLLLLDDVFDKLDSRRVAEIVSLVADADYGQIFLTDTNREHLDRILEQSGCDHALFRVDEGRISHEAE